LNNLNSALAIADSTEYLDLKIDETEGFSKNIC